MACICVAQTGFGFPYATSRVNIHLLGIVLPFKVAPVTHSLKYLLLLCLMQIRSHCDEIRQYLLRPLSIELSSWCKKLAWTFTDTASILIYAEWSCCNEITQCTHCHLAYVCMELQCMSSCLNEVIDCSDCNVSSAVCCHADLQRRPGMQTNNW